MSNRRYALLGLTLLSLIFLFTTNRLQAAQFQTFGDYLVHYNAINTGMLTPEVAKANGIIRSKNRALLNISVRKKAADGAMTDHAVAADVSTTAVNLSSQLKEIKMQEVREGDAIYYIGIFTITDQETLKFDVTVKPEFKEPSYSFKFEQQFFVE